MQQMRVLITAVLLLALAHVSAMAASLTLDEVPVLAIPCMTTPPTIDGTINPTEWRESLAIGGVADQGSNLQLPRPTTFYLAWDPGHLYLGIRVYVRPGYKPVVHDGRSPGMASVAEDAAELVVKPMGKNVPVNNKQAAFKFFLNSLGNVGDLSKLDLGQFLHTWGPNFVTAAKLSAPGTAPNGGAWCDIELSATPADFELTGEHRVGDEWRFMLGFNQMPGWMQARIPCMGSYFDADGNGYCRAMLVEQTPAVQLTMDSLANLASDGTASMQITAFNPNRTDANLSLDINVAGTIMNRTALAVPAGGAKTFTLNERLPADVKTGKVRVVVSQETRTLLSYTAYFNVGSLNWVLAPVKPRDPKSFDLQARFNPVRGLLLIKGDSYYLADPSTARSMHYRVTPENGGKPLAEGDLTTATEWFFQTMLTLPSLTPGKYRVEATMRLADGSVLGPMTRTIEKKDEAKAYPEWWGKSYGNVERVLPPFTPMTRIGSRVACWGREYQLDPLGLPQAVVSQNGAVSAQPARIVVVAGGKDIVIPLTGSPTFTSTQDWRVRFTGKTAGAGLQFTASGWVEQDGLVYVELTYGPSGKTPVAVEGLRIEYPLAATDADSLVCIGPGGNFSSKTTMLLPPKEGRLWSTLDTGRSGSGMTVGTFYPTVWIGNERRGFCWWADNDRGWFPDDAVAAHDAVREGNAVVLRNHIIGTPVQLTVPRTIAFSYIATPLRPFTKGWRMVGATEDGTFAIPHRTGRTDSKTGEKINPNLLQQNWIHPASRYPEEWSAIWAEQKPQADSPVRQWQWRDPYQARNGLTFAHMSFALHGYGRKTIIDDLYTYFGAEWEGGTDTWNPTYTDYAMYLFDGALREGGVRSTYWDITFPTMFSDPLTGLAYRLPNGRMQRGYNGWNLRRFMMRLQAMMVDNGLFPNGVGVHSTNSYVPIAMPWIDTVLDGERNWNLDLADLDWVDYYPIERMRSMSSPHAWGVPICWMANLDTTSAEKANAGKRIQAQWVWMHDSWRNPYIPQLSVMPSTILDWGINSEQTLYFPYWRNPYVTCADQDVLVSLWQLPDRVILGVFNYNRKSAKDVTLAVDLDALDLVPKLSWQEFVGVRDLWKADAKAPDAQLDFAGRKLVIKGLAPHTVRFIGIRKY